jgi:hypothetical protein
MSIFGGGQGSIHPAVVQALLQVLGGNHPSFRPADIEHAQGNDHEAAALWMQHHPGALNGKATGVPGYVGGQSIPDFGGDPNDARQKILQILMQRRLASPGPEQPQMGPQRGPFGPRGGGIPNPNLNY